MEVVQGYALARPDVRFQVVHEGRELLDALPAPRRPAAGSRERIGQIFGPELARELAEIPGGARRSEGEAIRGFVGTPGDGARPAPVRLRQPPPDPRPRRARHLLPRRARRVEAARTSRPSSSSSTSRRRRSTSTSTRRRRRSASAIPACSTGSTTPSAATLERARGEEAAPLRPPAAEPYVPFAWQGLGEQRAPVAWNRPAERPPRSTGASGGPSGSVELPVVPTRPGDAAPTRRSSGRWCRSRGGTARRARSGCSGSTRGR